jgi:hypothetical protein
MNAPPFRTDANPDTACGIVGHAACAARLSAIAALRDAAGPPGAPPLPPRFLRHCDEQTVVGIHAVLRAIAALPPSAGPLAGDAVVAASCQAGRVMAAKSLALLATGGAVTVSTHIVPQASLHSAAGAVSVALGMHGPHLGVSGGADALAEGLFAAITLATTSGAPRVWLVVSEWDEEPTLDAIGAATDDPVCRALALAIEPGAAATLGLEVHFPHPAPAAVAPAGGLAAFGDALEMCGPGGALVSWTLATPWAAEVRIMRRRVAMRPASRSREHRLREAA